MKDALILAALPTCAVCDREFPTPRGRGMHERMKHPEWVPSAELRLRRRSESQLRWVHKQSRSYRFLVTANKRGLGFIDPRTVLPDGPCHYCGGEATSWDHVIPRSRGGPHTVENLVPCCMPCNLRKNDGRPEQATVPSYVTLLCGWCWAPVRKRTADLNGRRYVGCSQTHVNLVRHHPIPFGRVA